jgi:predicted dehydrogenase
VALKVIQVGIGNMGNVWLERVAESTEFEFSGFVEINPEIIERQSTIHNLDKTVIFPSLDAALAAVSADAIIDVTPPAFRQPVAEIAFARRLPVLAEKPLGDVFETAQRIVQRANETGVLYMVAQNYRYNPQMMTLKSILDSGRLGAIGSITIEFYKGLQLTGFRDLMRQALVMDMSIHHFDLMRYLIGGDPVSVMGRSWRPSWTWNSGEDTASLILEFERGIVVSYVGSWATTTKTTPWNGNWRIECEKGALWLQDDEVFIQPRVKPGEEPAAIEKIEPLAPEYAHQAYLLHEFYEAITQGKAPATTCQDNIRSLAMVFKTLEAFDTGAPVRF